MKSRPYVVVTTAKDTEENINKFIQRNSDAGVDYFILFLDNVPHYDVCSIKKENVLVINSDDNFWGGNRHNNLNFRQRVHANLASAWLSVLSIDCWLFNLDLDEVLFVDHDKIESLSEEVKGIHLQPLEIVSSKGDGLATEANRMYFKRLLDEDELSLLYTLGAINQPYNRNYFNGHTQGKPGVVPSLDTHFKGHDVEFKNSGELVVSSALSLLHFDMPSLEDFIDKWKKSMGHDAKAGHKPQRNHIKNAFMALEKNSSITEEQRVSVYSEIFSKKVEDDLPLLKETGLVVEIEFPLREKNKPSFKLPENDLGKIAKVIDASNSRVFMYSEYEKRKNYVRDKAIEIMEKDPELSYRIFQTLVSYRPNGKKIKEFREKTKEIAGLS